MAMLNSQKVFHNIYQVTYSNSSKIGTRLKPRRFVLDRFMLGALIWMVV